MVEFVRENGKVVGIVEQKMQRLSSLKFKKINTGVLVSDGASFKNG